LDSAGYAGNVAQLKSGTDGNISYFLRSPSFLLHEAILQVENDGTVYWRDMGGAPFYVYGVRPIFKLKPSAVILASEIVDTTPTAWQTEATEDYIADNYKLTVVSDAPKLLTLSASGSALIAPSGSLTLTGTIGGTAEKLVYKIVNSTHTIVGYGVGDSTSLTVNAQDLSGADLANGNYALYVWAQKDNDINSPEGSNPRYIRLTIGNPPPVTSPTPTPSPSPSPSPSPTEEPSPSPSPTPTATPTPPPPPTPTPPPPGVTPDPVLVVDEDGVPQGQWTWDDDTGEWIFDPIVPLADVPATGDSGAALWMALAVTVLCGAAAIGTRKKTTDN
jgi:hypothetical protein